MKYHQVCSITCYLFLYSYENEFLDNMIKSGHRRLAGSFNLCYRYIDDLIVFNNKKFLDLKEIYLSELTVEKANKSDHLADYLDLTFIIDSGDKLSGGGCQTHLTFLHLIRLPLTSLTNVSNRPTPPSSPMNENLQPPLKYSLASWITRMK